MNESIDQTFKEEIDEVSGIKMPEKFYLDLEGFLQQPTPCLQDFNIPNIENSLLSDLKQIKCQLPYSPKPSSGKAEIKKKLSNKRIDPIKSIADVATKTDFDYNLLQEAFKFSVTLNDFDSEVRTKSRITMENVPINPKYIQTDSQGNIHIDSQSLSPASKFPQNSPDSVLKNVYCSGLVGKLRSQTGSESSRAARIREKRFNVLNINPVEDKRSADYERIIQSLQSGENLHKLRAELAESKQQLLKSREVMEDIVKETLSGERRSKRTK